MDYFKSLFKERVDIKQREYEDWIAGLFSSEVGQQVLNHWIAEDLRQTDKVADAQILAIAEGRRSRVRDIIYIIDRVASRQASHKVVGWQ